MPGPGLKVLVVDDDADDAELAGEYLHEAKHARYETVYARSLAEALERVAAGPLDAILLDLGLPDSRGLDTFVRMQKACAPVPIVVLTGPDDEECGLEAARRGAQDSLVKGRLHAGLLVRAVHYAIERQRLTGAIAASEAEYRRLFEAAKDGILLLDAVTGQITDVNPFLTHLLGFTRDELMGKKLWEIGLFADTRSCHALFEKLQLVGLVRYEHLPLVARDGSLRHVEFVSNSYVVAGRKRIQCNVRDISVRVRVEEALREERAHLDLERQQVAGRLLKVNAELEVRVRQRTAELETANQELEAFAYSVSHDLRAPLRAIDGFSRILITECCAGLSEKSQHYLGMVSDNARQMGRLIDDLLRFSRTSRHALSVDAVAPGALVRECLSELAPELEGRVVDIQLEELPGCRGDGALLKQVWLNLISNAIKFTRGRDPARIEIGSQVQDGETVYHVRDNGVGFDMQYRDKLFGVFQRLHSPEEFEGTGVGLALVQRIVHRHGGRVWAEGQVGSGATFWFTLGCTRAPLSPDPLACKVLDFPTHDPSIG